MYLPGEAPPRLEVIRVARRVGRRQEKRQEGEQQEAFRHGLSCALWYGMYTQSMNSARNQFGMLVILKCPWQKLLGWCTSSYTRA